MILISKVFRRLLNSFNAILTTVLQRSHRSEFQDQVLVFVYILSAEIYFCLQLTIKCFLFSVQKCRMTREF